jgi:predicted TIM-barrel fold metal-dependent hydrolase
MIGAHTGWPWVDELLSVCYKWENIWFGVDAWAPKYLSPQIIQFINSRMGRDRCIWGTNGLPWQESLRQLDELGLKEEVKRKLLRENAVELFKLDSKKEFVVDASTSLAEAGVSSPAREGGVVASP